MDALKARPDDETTFLPKAPGGFQRGACKVQRWIEKDLDATFQPEPGEPAKDFSQGPGTTPQAVTSLEPAYQFSVAGRYHIFVNYGCGWSNQLLMVRALCALQDSISVTHVGMYRAGQRGTPEYQGYVIAERADTSGNGFTCMRDVYNAGDPTYGVDQLTIPVLFDKKTRRVVSNDPAQIHLMLDFFADELRGSTAPAALRLYPPELQAEIEAINARIFPGINNGVYCCWFAGSDAAFEEAFEHVQATLMWLEERLADGRHFLCATEHPTLADVRAFPHLVRFDLIYFRLMMRERGMRTFVGDSPLPKLREWIKRMFELPAVYETLDLQVATRFYFSSMSVERSDEVYDRERELMQAAEWLPTREQWAQKRVNEQLTDAQVSNLLS